MNSMKLVRLTYLNILLISSLFYACTQQKNPLQYTNPEKTVKILEPQNGQVTTFGDTVTIEAINENTVDQCLMLFINGKLVSESASGQIMWQLAGGIHYRLGTLKIKAVALENMQVTGEDSIAVTIESMATPLYHAEILNEFDHDSLSFTQGLVYEAGVFFESGGLYGQSSLRRTAVETGEILQIHYLQNRYFAEGLTIWQNNLIQLTWREQTAFVYDKTTFDSVGLFTYSREGWGLTADDQHLIMSDGSSRLYFLDPQTFQIRYSLIVSADHIPVSEINELESIHGDVFANIWRSSYIARIDINTGQVVGWIDLESLVAKNTRGVLNGIAYDAQNDRLFVTGKLWSKVYQIGLLPQKTKITKPMHSRKMTARLPKTTISDAPIVLRTSTGTGHGFGTPLEERIREDIHK